MATDVALQGQVLSDSRQNFSDGADQNVQLNPQGAVLVANSLLAEAEVARLGATFVAGTITAVAPVAAMPTTASHLSLYCPSSGTKSLMIHSISAYTVVSAGAALVLQMAAHVTTVAVTSITGTTAQTPKGISGAGTATATIFSAVTTVNNGNWHVVGQSVNAGAATATIALGTYADVYGRYIINPGMHLDLAMLCSAAASATCSMFVTWSEVQL